jgi:uncharacterized coiled-coil protein SlyX
MRETITRMVSSLPVSLQASVLEELQKIVTENKDEAERNMRFE